MALTRFPDHDAKRVYLSSVLSFELPPPDSAHSDRLSVAVFWIDQGSTSARELSLEFAIDLMEHGALAIVVGGSGAKEAGALFERAVAEGEFVRREEEAVGIWAQPEATLESLLWTAAETAMPPDAYADQPWDVVAWARSGDPSAAAFRKVLPHLGQIVEARYEEGGDEDE